MKPSKRLEEMMKYIPNFYNEACRLQRIEAKIQAILEYLDEQSEKPKEGM